jgi:hypothetical protein
VICDEVAYWVNKDTGANPDVAVLNATLWLVASALHLLWAGFNGCGEV